MPNPGSVEMNEIRESCLSGVIWCVRSCDNAESEVNVCPDSGTNCLGSSQIGPMPSAPSDAGDFTSHEMVPTSLDRMGVLGTACGAYGKIGVFAEYAESVCRQRVGLSQLHGVASIGK